MKLFILLAFCAAVGQASQSEDDFFNEVDSKWDNFAEMKALETCYGKNIIEEYMVRTKKAMQKCYGMELPSLKIYDQISPKRFVMAMMRGLKDKQGERMKHMMQKMMMPKQKQPVSVAYVPYVPNQQAQQSPASGEIQMMMKMMKLVLMKEMVNKMVNPTGGAEKLTDAQSARGFEEGSNFEMGDLLNELFKAAGSSKAPRSRRDAEELYDLGEELTSKLDGLKMQYVAQISNMSCFMQQFKIVDENDHLDLDGILEDAETWEWESEWFKQKIIEASKKCVAMAEATPAGLFATDEVDEKWVRIRTYYNCYEEMEKWACMNLDTKRMMEKHFSPLEDLIMETGLDEDALLYMTQAIIDDSFSA